MEAASPVVDKVHPVVSRFDFSSKSTMVRKVRLCGELAVSKVSWAALWQITKQHFP